MEKNASSSTDPRSDTTIGNGGPCWPFRYVPRVFVARHNSITFNDFSRKITSSGRPERISFIYFLFNLIGGNWEKNILSFILLFIYFSIYLFIFLFIYLFFQSNKGELRKKLLFVFFVFLSFLKKKNFQDTISYDSMFQARIFVERISLF